MSYFGIMFVVTIVLCIECAKAGDIPMVIVSGVCAIVSEFFAHRSYRKLEKRIEELEEIINDTEVEE